MLSQKNKKIILAIGDLAVLYVSLCLTLVLRYGTTRGINLFESHFLPFSIIYLLWIISFYITDLYNYYQKNIKLFLQNFTRSLLINGLIAIVFFYFIRIGVQPKRVLFINLLISAILIYLWRLFYNKISSNATKNQNVLFVGMDKKIKEIIKVLRQNPRLGYHPELIFSQTTNIDDEICVVKYLENLSSIMRDKKIRNVVVAPHYANDQKVIQTLFNNLPARAQFFNLSVFFEEINGKIPVESINEKWFLENINESEMIIYEHIKRIVDIVLAIIAFILTLPFTPLIAILIKLDSKGPIFFRQIRTGLYGKPFLAMKFRTMIQDAEKNGPQWAQKNDARVTRLGRILRKTRIDEIPQLFNILRGEMSFVGPRPERPEFIEELEKKIPFYRKRLIIKPGLTGWAQINFPYGASVADALEKMQYDLYYIKNRSIPLDVSIILKTINTILRGGGQ